MKQVRCLLAVAAALLVAAALPAAAAAHVELAPQKAPAGKPVKLAFEIGHGCDGAATTALVVQIPKGASEIKPLPIEGWKAAVNADTLTWKGGPLADHDHQEFPFRATMNGSKGEKVAFKAIQKCEGGAETAWIQPAKAGEESEHPAPALTLTSSAAAPADDQAAADEIAGEDAAATGEPTATDETAADSTDDDEGGSGRSLLLIIIIGLAIGTIVGLIVRARRRS